MPSATAFPIRCRRPSRRSAAACPMPTISPSTAAALDPLGPTADRLGARQRGRSARRGGRRGAGRARTVTRCLSSEMNRSSGIGWPNRKPWPRSQPMLTSAIASEAFSRPMPTASAAEAVGEIDHGLADRRIDLVGAAADDERAVELHLGERQLLELRQRSIALAEVVDREPDVVLGELLAQVVGERDLGDDLLFGDVDHQARPVVHLRAVRAHDLADRQLDQAVDRDVDGDPQVDAEPRQFSPDLSALTSACSASVSTLASSAPGMKLPGSSTPCCGMADAREGLGAGKLLSPQVDLRLVPELDPVVLERFGKRDLDAARRRADGRA